MSKVVAAHFFRIADQCTLVRRLNEIPSDKLNNWEQKFRTSITKQIANHWELTPKQIDKAAVILAFSELL